MSYDQYDADYFLRGQETGKSLYKDYRWLPDLTRPMARRIMEHCDIRAGDKVLDFGCARGYLVRALREWGVQAFGYDVSEWAIENADPEAKPYVCKLIPSYSIGFKYDWVIAKDVLEHVELVDHTIQGLMKVCDGMFVVVPLSRLPGNRYVIEEYEKDVTHVQRLPLLNWVGLFLKDGWRVECAYRVPGVKDNYYREGWEYGNGFITARRIK